jgi:hypothetical protein
MIEALRSRMSSALSKVILRSRRMAAFSLSAHSERLTNSKASGTCSAASKGPVPRAEIVSALDEDSDRGNSSAVSLKRSKETATLRPMAGLWDGGSMSSVGVEVEESEPETLGVRRRDLADFRFVKETEPEGRVTALDIVRLRRGGEA